MKRTLGIKQEVHYVAVFDDIGFAFGFHLARFFGTLFAAQGHEVVVADGLCTDEATFKVAVDHTCGLWGGCALFDRPSAGLFGADGEVGLQMQA